MSATREHQKRAAGVQEGRSQQDSTPMVPENAGVGSTSNARDKSAAAEDPQPSGGTADDEEARLNSELVTLWTQRLQVLTVVSSFLASMDGQLFSLSALNTEIGLTVGTASREVVYTCLAAALIFHVIGALLAYIASFALVRYRIVEAVDEDKSKHHSRRVVLEPLHPLHLFITFLQQPERLRFLSISRSPRSTSPPPLSLLTRCFYTTLCLAALGFLFALVGILAYVWAGLPMVVGVASTVCVGVGISAAIWAIAM